MCGAAAVAVAAGWLAGGCVLLRGRPSDLSPGATRILGLSGSLPENEGDGLLVEMSIGEFARRSRLSLKPEDLGVRITYLASRPPGETSAPECDFAVPFA
jgi:hypothetical protein